MERKIYSQNLFESDMTTPHSIVRYRLFQTKENVSLFLAKDYYKRNKTRPGFKSRNPMSPYL